MSPRKKSKPNHQAPVDDGNFEPTSTPASPAEDNLAPLTLSTRAEGERLQDAASDKSLADPVSTSNRSTADTQTLNKKASRKWLGGGGSWRSKAPAIVKTAKESIGVAGGATSEIQKDHKPQDESPKKFLTKRKSSKGSAIPAAMTKLNVSSDGAVGEAQGAPKDLTNSAPPSVEEPPLPPDPPKIYGPTSTFGWRGWWSRPDDYPLKNVEEDAQKTPLPGPTPSEEPDAKSKELSKVISPADPPPDQDTEMKDSSPENAVVRDTEMKDSPAINVGEARNGSSGSWFWLWSNAQNAQTKPLVADATQQRSDATEPVLETETYQHPDVAIEQPEPAEITESTKRPSKPSGWAFWFKEKPKEETKAPEDGQDSAKKVGEVAVFNTPSQSSPEAAQFNEQQEHQPNDTSTEPSNRPEEEPAPKKSFRSLRGRPKAKTTLKDIPSQPPPAPSPSRPDTTDAVQAQTTPKPVAKVKQEPPNLILPEFKSTYRLVQKPSYWQQIRQYFLGGEHAMPHLHINPSPPRIRKAVAIGVHGYFPAPILQRVLGQPQGTSIRFANAAAASIRKWTEARGYTPEIEQIALEGEGFIAERVNTLWKLLLNWIEHIKEADFILVACHSQGVPVAIMLVAKLIQLGCVSAARIGVCAMAGVNMGPFRDYNTRYLGQTAAELFEFNNPKSLVSQMYLAGLDEALRNGVRIFYVGSIDDQLVSLESSTFSTISHPYIYRAVFVDGRIHPPDFLTHLVGFALKLRNLGIPDHGLVRELSPALAGSLYAGEGHSRVYEDPRVYELAVQHSLETTSLPAQSQQSQKRPGTSASFKGINIPIPDAKVDKNDKYTLRVKDYETTGAGNNPYYLPWAMRGLLEEEFVKRELGEEVEGLLGMYEDWKPTSKGLKDVKFRLEMVRSML